jgi:hypothetical protein
MAVTDDTLRILWARAGGRCALCRREVRPRPGDGGGRVLRIADDGGDRYDNLVLLCGGDHGGDHGGEGLGGPGGRAAYLLDLKDRHEEWVHTSTSRDQAHCPPTRYEPSFDGVTLLPRVRAGRQLARLLDGAHSMQYDHDPLGAKEEGRLEEFLRYLRRLLDLWGQYDEAERRRAAVHLDVQLHGLAAAGMLVCAARHSAETTLAGTPGTWVSLRVWVLNEGNPGRG